MYSVVLLNFNRPNNVIEILDNIINYNIIDEILISNGKIETSINYSHKKVIIKNDYIINNSYGLDRRFLNIFSKISSNYCKMFI